MDQALQALPQLLALAEAYARELPAAPPALPIPQGAGIAALIDHTLLRADATPSQVKRLCTQARECRFKTVCLNPVHVRLARGLLRDAGVGICAVIAFPLGASLPEDKVYEAGRVLADGATEVDMVLNIGALKEHSFELVMNDILFVTRAVHAKGALVKVIIETALLTRWEKIAACLIARAAGADFVKTSTGFGPGGATVDDVQLMRRVVGTGMGVKAAGGIRSLQDARAMIAAGASRVGSSAGVVIYNEAIKAVNER